MQLSAPERRDWLRLSRTEHVGPVTFRSLLARFEFGLRGAGRITAPGKRGGGKNLGSARMPVKLIARSTQLTKLGGRLIASCEAGLSARPGGAGSAPPLISVLGHAHLLQKEMIAIVGARNASALARKFADMLARDLGFAGLVVVSGPGARHRHKRA